MVSVDISEFPSKAYFHIKQAHYCSFISMGGAGFPVLLNVEGYLMLGMAITYKLQKK
jgi:hypothetical protein